eukprot:scaffold1050_cov51-Attheya_sp.AAC.9
MMRWVVEEERGWYSLEGEQKEMLATWVLVGVTSNRAIFGGARELPATWDSWNPSVDTNKRHSDPKQWRPI